MSTIFSRITEQCQHYAQDIYDFTSQIIATESLSGNEEGLAVVVADKMQELGFHSIITDAMGNVRGSMGHGPYHIAGDAHMDTVDIGDIAQWHKAPFSGKQDTENIYGRGASDMKSALAALLYAGKVIADVGLEEAVTFTVCATVQEEPCEGLAWEYLIENEGLRPDFVIIAEPSNDCISLAQKGRMEMTVAVTGLSAHGSAPHLGKNAIYAMANIIQELEALNDNMTIEDADLGKGSLTVSEIRSQAPSRCSVADHCEIAIDRRLTWGESPEYALEQITSLSSVQAANAQVACYTFDEPSYTGLVPQKECVFPAWKIDHDHVVTQSTIAAYTALFNQEPTLTTWPFSTNGVAIMGKHHIPVIGYGPGIIETCHMPNEYVRKDAIIRATMMYAAMCATYAKQGAK